MCGRYATTRSAGQLSEHFESYDETGGRAAVDYNVAPTATGPIIRRASPAPSEVTGSRLLSVARWGLVPAWARDPRGAARMINARVETVTTSRAYAPSFASRRCLVPADGWYEWVRTGETKQPYFMTATDGGVLAFAGLWSVWDGGPEAPLLTFTVLTTAACGELAAVHDRMPLLLPRRRWSAWLGEGGGGEAAELLAPDLETLAGIEIRPVGRAVGNVRNNGPALIAKAQPAAAAHEGSMTLF